MSATPTAPPSEGRSPHSVRYIVLRVLAAVAVAAGAFAVDRLWLTDEPTRSTFGSRVRPFEIESELLGRALPARVVVPAGAPPKDRTLLVFLHGRGEDERSYLVEPMFEALASLRTRAPVIAFPSSDDSSYWHNRESGQWASYVLAEVIPQLVDRFDIDPGRIAIGGISMGGFGAYDIARLDPGRFCAVGGHSPAIWETSSETADGAFDDADDFERNDVISIAGMDPSPYAELRLWLDAGEDDPFLPGDRAFEEALRAGGARPILKGALSDDDSEPSSANWEHYLDFYAYSLQHCEDEAEAKPEDGSEPPLNGAGNSTRRSGGASEGADRGGGGRRARAGPSRP